MRLLKGDELTTLYPEIFERCFGFQPDKQIPRIVTVTDDLMGFISGYMLDKENFYLAWGGHVNGFKAIRKQWVDWEAQFKGAGVKWFQTNVENTNSSWQRILLGMGWLPYGMKTTQGKIFIEYYKEL
jgi:hypothetical protein